MQPSNAVAVHISPRDNDSFDVGSTSDERPRVLHIIPAFQTGGAERMLVDIFRFLEHDGYDLQLCVLGRKSDCYPSFRPKRDVIELGFRSTWRDRRAVRDCLNSLQAIVGDFQPQLIHSHLWFADYIGAMLSIQTGLPRVCHIQNTWEWMASRRMGHRLRRWQVIRQHRKADSYFIACSEAAGAYYRRHLKIPGDRISVVPNSVDVDAFTPRDVRRPFRNPLVLGTIGRFAPMKGHDLLIKSVAELRDRGINVTLRIAGSGELHSSYMRLIEALGIVNHVEFVGEILDVAEFLHDLDIYVHPSVSAEGLSLAILEALSCGVPVIATDVAGAREALDHGKCGVLCRSHSTTELTTAIERLGRNESLAEQFAEQGRVHVAKNYSIQIAVRDIEQIYESVTGMQTSTQARAHST